MGISTKGPSPSRSWPEIWIQPVFSGRLILIPTLNNSATQAGQRVSPLDGLNLNRTFPGDPYGSITEQISFYLNDHLFLVADVYADLQSGGSSLHLLPSAIVEPALETEHMERNIALARAFAAPYTVVIDNLGDPRTAGAAAVRARLATVVPRWPVEELYEAMLSPSASVECRT